MTDEDLIADEDVVVTISGRGYIKRQPVDDLPPPAPRRQGDHRPRHPRGGRRRAPARREHPRLGAVLHQPRPRLQRQGPRDPGRQPPGQGHPDHQPAGRPGRVRARSRWRRSCCPTSSAGTYLVLATRKGIIKKTPLEQFERVRSTGHPGDHHRRRRRAGLGRRLDRARTTSSSPPRRASSPASTRPRSGPMGRDAAGVIGIRLAREGDAVVGDERRPARRRPARADRDRLRQARAADRVPAQAPRRAGRPADRARGPQDRRRRRGPAGHREDEELLLISAGGQVVRTETNTINRYSPERPRRHRHAPRTRATGSSAIAAFRAGLAEQRRHAATMTPRTGRRPDRPGSGG